MFVLKQNYIRSIKCSICIIRARKFGMSQAFEDIEIGLERRRARAAAQGYIVFGGRVRTAAQYEETDDFGIRDNSSNNSNNTTTINKT